MTAASHRRPFVRPLLFPLLVLAAALTAASPALAEGHEAGAGDSRRAFGIEDLYRVVSPAEMALSPDGKRVAFVRRERELAKGKQERDIWLLDVEGARGVDRACETGSDVCRPLTSLEGKSESSLAWVPDGSGLTFVADRGEGEAIWLLPAAGGEARVLAEVPIGAFDLVWSDDGRRLAFTSEVYPECGADMACNTEKSERRESGPLAAHVADHLFYRHWNRWWDGKVPHVLVLDAASGKIVDATPERVAPPVFYLWGGVSYDLAPDGGALVYQRLAAPFELAARSTNDDLVLVELDFDGPLPAPRVLTRGNGAWDGTPKFSPDGRTIAYRRQAQPGYEADEFELAVLDLRSGEARDLTLEYDNWVDDFDWLPDGSGLIALTEERGRTPLYRVALDGSRPKRVVRDAQIDAWALAPDGRTVVASRRAVDSPPELWRYDIEERGRGVRLSALNLALEEEVDIRPAERMVVQGAGGLPVEVFVVKPHGFDEGRRYPLIVNVHGGPQSMWSDAFRGDWQVYPGAGYVVAFLNPTGSTGYGQAYTEAISRDWGGRVYVDIMRVTDDLAALPWIDETRIGAMGWSWGGYAMNWMLGHTDRYAAIASMMGVYDPRSMWGATEELWFPEWEFGGTPFDSALYERFNPARYATAFSTPTLVVTGELDYRVPYTQSLQLFTALQRRGVPSRLVVLPNAGHWPGWYEMALYYTAHLDWFERWLGGGGPPWSVEDFAANAVFDPETGERIDGEE